MSGFIQIKDAVFGEEVIETIDALELLGDDFPQIPDRFLSLRLCRREAQQHQD
jgi:hypothetical protein